MKFPVSNASVSRNSYRHGDDFTLCLRFDSLETRGNHLESVTNVSVDLFRTERQRNQFAFGFGATPQIDGSALTITQKLTADLPVGLYVVSTITLCWNEHQHENVLVRFTPAFFAIVANGEADLDKDTLNLEIERVTEERRAYAQRQMFVPSALGAPTLQKFRVLIFGTGCILHAPQQLEGFAIVPLGRGFSYGRMLEIVNQTLKRGGIRQLSFDAQIEVQYEQATPAFMIEYSCVIGQNHSDTLDYCRKHADLMFDLLALDRGQKPREFFCMAISQVTGESWHLFIFPGYQGNLISDFNPAATANLIESVTPKLEKHPFLRLLVRSEASSNSWSTQK